VVHRKRDAHVLIMFNIKVMSGTGVVAVDVLYYDVSFYCMVDEL